MGRGIPAPIFEVKVYNECTFTFGGNKARRGIVIGV